MLDRAEELDRSRPIVTVCRSGSRSAESAKDLASEGFDVRNLEGGMEAWAAQGLSVVAAGGGLGSVVDSEPPTTSAPSRCNGSKASFSR